MRSIAGAAISAAAFAAPVDPPPATPTHKLYVSPATREAIGPEVYNYMQTRMASTRTNIILLTSQDYAAAKGDAPEGMQDWLAGNADKLQRHLGVPDDVAKKDGQNVFADHDLYHAVKDRLQALPTQPEGHDVCVIGIPQQRLPLHQQFNADADMRQRRAGWTFPLDGTLSQAEPVLVAAKLVHEFDHCAVVKPAQAHGLTVTPGLTLQLEISADDESQRVLPAITAYNDIIRPLAGLHESLQGGDGTHAIALGRIFTPEPFHSSPVHAGERAPTAAENRTYEEVFARTTAAYNGLTQKMVSHHATTQPDSHFVKQALNNLVSEHNYAPNISPVDMQRLTQMRHQLNNNALPYADAARSLMADPTLSQPFLHQVSNNLPLNPTILSGLIRQLEPQQLTADERTAANLYTSATQQLESGALATPASESNRLPPRTPKASTPAAD